MDGDNSRFTPINDQELTEFIEGQKNCETMRKTKAHVKLFKSFLKMKHEQQEPEAIEAQKLDQYLAIFFVSVKKDGKDKDREYEPTTPKSMQSSIERYLKERKYAYSIVNDGQFFLSREAIRSKCRELKKQGKGTRPTRKRAPTQNELNTMWEKGALGADSPDALQQTMWWIMCTRFGKRANKENREMKWGDIQVKTNAAGLRYLVNNERETKTRHGQTDDDAREQIRVYEDQEHPEYCPVTLFNLYVSKRPTEMCEPNSNFYLQPKKYRDINSMTADPIWYKRQIHGLNSIKGYMKSITKAAGLPSSVGLSNISARKHLIGTCRKAGVPDGTTVKVYIQNERERKRDREREIKLDRDLLNIYCSCTSMGAVCVT
jgi:hypothetical protein